MPNRTPSLGSLVTRFKRRKQLAVQDGYLSWLTFANAGMLHPGNLGLFQHAIEGAPPSGAIVEIGAFCGLSTNVLSYLLKKFEKTNLLYTCDRWRFEGSEQGGFIGNGITHSAYRDYVKSSFVRNVEFFGGEPKPFAIEALSDEFFELWRTRAALQDLFGRVVNLGGPIALCYVDGNHTFEYAKRDFENCDEFLVAGGFVLFDDSEDGNRFGLTPLMREIERSECYELVAKNPNYLFRKVK